MHSLLRAAVIIFLVIAVPTVYAVISWKIAAVFPTAGRVMITAALAIGYGFISTIVATVFFSPRVGLFLFVPLALISIPKAWKDAKLDAPGD